MNFHFAKERFCGVGKSKTNNDTSANGLIIRLILISLLIINCQRFINTAAFYNSFNPINLLR